MLFRKGKLLGKDENGNSYYELSTGKRCVVYNGVPDPRSVPANWHVWLHYSDDKLPALNKKKIVKCVHNIIGNKNYYESWNPDNLI